MLLLTLFKQLKKETYLENLQFNKNSYSIKTKYVQEKTLISQASWLIFVYNRVLLMRKTSLFTILLLLFLQSSQAVKISKQIPSSSNIDDQNQSQNPKRNLQMWNPLSSIESSTNNQLDGNQTQKQNYKECKDDSECSFGFICNTSNICQLKQCFNNIDCFPDIYGIRVCRNYSCVHPACLDDRSCHPGHYCFNYMCVEMQCQSSYQCPSGQQCDRMTHQCTSTKIVMPRYMPSNNRYCQFDTDCFRGQQCNRTFKRCSSKKCQKDEDCGDQLVCNSIIQQCTVKYCFSNGDCQSGQECVGRMCRKTVIEDGVGWRCKSDQDCKMQPNLKCGQSMTCESKVCQSNDDCPSFGWYCDIGMKKCKSMWRRIEF